MPAGSDPDRPSSGRDDVLLPQIYRPLGPRIAGYVAGGALLVVFVAMWFSFDEQTKQAIDGFQRGTAIALLLVGYAALFALVRSRAEARADGLMVINGYRQHHYVWEEIVAVRLPQGAPWVTLDLSNGHTVSVLGIQGSDGERAKQAVRTLRLLIDG